MTPGLQHDSKFSRELTRRSARTSVLHPLILVLLAAASGFVRERAALFFWLPLAGLTLVICSRFLVYRRSMSHGWTDGLRRMQSGTFWAASLIWSSLALGTYASTGRSVDFDMLLLCIGGVAAGKVAHAARDLAVVRTALTILLAPIGTALTVSSVTEDRWLGVTILVYFAFLWMTARNTHSMFIEIERSHRDEAQQRETLDAVLDAIPGGVSWIDSEGRYEGVNARLAAAFGRRKEDFVGQPIGFITGTTELHERLSEFRRSGRPEDLVELRIAGPTEERWSLVAFRSFRQAGREKTLIVAIDIEDRKRAEAELESVRLRGIEAARLSALGSMAAGVAHEINNPLAVIKGRSQQIAERLASGELTAQGAAEALKKIDSTVDRIARIVTGLRNMSRSDGRPGDLETTAVSGIVEEVLDICETRFRDHGVRLETRLEIGDPRIDCRPAQIGQILLNLVANAHDAVESLTDRWVRVEVTEHDEHVEIVVTDSGQGVPEAHRSKLFEPFFTTKPAGQGTGLGLSISRSIAFDHGGDLRLDVGGRNTRFVLTLPKTRAAATSHPDGRAA